MCRDKMVQVATKTTVGDMRLALRQKLTESGTEHDPGHRPPPRQELQDDPPGGPRLPCVGRGGGQALREPRLATGALCPLGREGDQGGARHGSEQRRRVECRGTQVGEPRQDHSYFSNGIDRSSRWVVLPSPERGREPAPSGESAAQSTDGRDAVDLEAAPGHDDGGQAPQGQLSAEGCLAPEPPGVRAVLSNQESIFLAQAANSFSQELLGSMRRSGRLFLLEVCCSEGSLLSAEVATQGLRAERASLFNGHDLMDPAGLRKTLELIRKHKPMHVWISTECGAFSPLQNWNQRTPQQRVELQQKQRLARKQHIGGLVVAYYARHLGSEVHWEWSRRCRAWKWELMDKYRQDVGTSTAIIGGCRVGLQNPSTGALLGKEWRIESTCQSFASAVHLPCVQSECPGKHVTCEGSMTRLSAFYTPKMVKRVVHYLRESSQSQQKCQGSDATGISLTKCCCKSFQFKGQGHVCPACMFDMEASEPQALAQVTTEGPSFSQQEKQKWLHKLHLLHSAAGHGSIQQMKETLTKKEVDPRIISLLDEFHCSVCAERKRPAPRRVATLEVHPGRWKVVLADGAYWVHPETGVRNVVGLYMDQNSRFLVGKVLTQHKTHLPNAQDYVRFFQEHWQQYFGKPETLRYDAEGTWRSKALDDAFSQIGIMLDPVPGDAHWHISPLERSIAWVKECLSRLAGEGAKTDVQALVSHAVDSWNNRECVRGFSPKQHALGMVPDPAGHLFETDIQGLPVHMMGNPEGEVAQSARLRAEAEATFIKWQSQQRVSRALNSRSRKTPEFAPGDLVYYWRTQMYGKKASGTRIQTGSSAGYAGPARILALETRRDGEQQARPSSVVWLVRNNRLLKASVEQFRFASAREEVMHEFERPSNLPWTMTELTAPLGREEFEDITAEVPSEEDLQIHGEAPRWRAPTRRVRGKRTASEPAETEARQPRARSRSPPQNFPREVTEAPSAKEATASAKRRRSRTPPADRQGGHLAFWAEETAAVAIEIPMPNSRHGWKLASRDLETYLASALKKKSIEVHERRMDSETKARFRLAKLTEVKKFLSSKALEAIPLDKQPPKEAAMRMRWILTWKTDHAGETSPKARAVILGYQDPLYEERVTYAPTTTRHTRQLMLQYAACKKWSAWKGDVAAAFLQGRECEYDLYCIPTPEICESMQVPKESVVRLRKACYGLVQAPYEWYETVREYLLQIGFTQCGADPCCWVLHVEGETRAIISGHVDDFMMVGSPEDPYWAAAKSSLQEHFRWGEFELNDFTQCGVQIQCREDGSFTLSQERYMENVKEIPISKERRSQRKEATTEREQTMLRAVLGSLSWHASQVGFRYAAYVSLALSEVPQSTVESLMEANQLVHKMRDAARTPMRIHALGDPSEVLLLAWTDASNQNRRDGSSTGGIFIGAAHKSMAEGCLCEVSPMFWSSSKLRRVCRSPGSAEARAVIDGEDVLYLLRYQWGELQGLRHDLRDPDATVQSIPGIVVTDSRNVYDRMQQPYISPTGEEKRVDLELLALKESQVRSRLDIRWVNSQAMLANSLTKRGEDQQFDRFVACGYKWKIVDDPEMFSGRERTRRGLDGLGEPQLQGVLRRRPCKLSAQELLASDVIRHAAAKALVSLPKRGSPTVRHRLCLGERPKRSAPRWQRRAGLQPRTLHPNP